MDMENSTSFFLESSSPSSNQTTGPDGKGSLFCSYNKTSSNYSLTRRPWGIGFTLGAISVSGFSLSKARLLDIGCGTGSFIGELWPKLEHVTGLEINDGMLTQAKASLKKALKARRVTLVQSSAINLPFAPESFHAVTINVVIHHFPEENNFAYLKQVFKNVFRTLKAGGCLVLTHSLPQQCRNGFWYAPLLPEAMDNMCELSPSRELIINYLQEVGFTVDEGEFMTPLHATYQYPYLEKYGIDGAFVQEYRDGDSIWAMAESTGELETCQGKIREMQKKEIESSWLEKREAARKLSGQMTFFVARKQHTFSRLTKL